MTQFSDPTPPTAHEALFREGGEMSVLMRDFDWASTPLGPPATWPERLRTYVELMLASRQPMYLAWTHELIALYNDAYRPILGADKHPGALGRRTADIFGHDGYPGLKPYYDAALTRGEGAAFVDILVPLVRYGYLEECYFDVGYTPVQGDTGVEGVFSTVNETTERVLAARRTKTLAVLTERLLGLAGAPRIADAVRQTVLHNPHDLPFALLYLPTTDAKLHLAASVGLDDSQTARLSTPPEAWTTLGEARVVPIAPLPAGPWPEPVTQMAVLPLTHSEEATSPGLLVIGLNARKRLDDSYRDFLRLLSGQVASALRSAVLTEVLQARNVELNAHTRALVSFAELSRDLTFETEPHTLIGRTQTLALDLLPAGFSQYFELEDGRWRVRSQVGQVNTPELQTLLNAGLPFEDTPNLLIPWQRGEAYYQEVYDHAADHLSGSAAYPAATVTLPIFVGEQVRGVLGFALFEARAWSRADRAVLETVAHSLSLALARAEHARQRDEERAALVAFTAFSEVVGSETDVRALFGRAAALLRETRDVNVTYFEREGDLFRPQEWTEDFPPDVLARLQEGNTLAQPGFAQAEREHGVVFVDDWDARAQGGEKSGADGGVAFQPFFQGSEMVAMMIMAPRGRRRWSERDKGIFRAVGRSLGLALERAAQARQLTAQRDTLDVRTRELGTANEELEAFSYSVSHDLRTPVRHILGFNELLRKSLGDKLDVKAARYLTVVDDAAARMNTLIDAMLDLSRTARQPLRLAPVDLNVLVRQVRQELAPDVRGRAVCWEVAALPPVTGDHALLRQVMLNLLSNALKYTGTRAEARVEVWAEERPGEWAIFVRDDGVGFDPRYQERLFGVFQRLHRAEDFEGTGVGLANVRRIVERHGGRVTATSVPGEGATFGFTLPKQL